MAWLPAMATRILPHSQVGCMRAQATSAGGWNVESIEGVEGISLIVWLKRRRLASRPRRFQKPIPPDGGSAHLRPVRSRRGLTARLTLKKIITEARYTTKKKGSRRSGTAGCPCDLQPRRRLPGRAGVQWGMQCTCRYCVQEGSGDGRGQQRTAAAAAAIKLLGAPQYWPARAAIQDDFLALLGGVTDVDAQAGGRALGRAIARCETLRDAAQLFWAP
ncbi:hypothetical protein EJ04DRAFT_153025 [Polyplosphaeria fusca]|uniref:Uncharacterized protein n=1 Tax=Polyplosphaeria fusca TaxID=682080 RepID=A0A9P4R452_9PLEO|nr:hypothetical protein EJ04DRAFT_153025 [Polyplosphaeria fusca]